METPVVVQDGPDRTDTAPLVGPRVQRIAGNLTFQQDAAVNCPVYLQGPGTSSADELDLRGAVDFTVIFTWTPVVDVFRGARIGFARLGTSVGSELPDVVGTSQLEWSLGPAALAEIEEPGRILLRIEGPYCPEGSSPGQTGIAYTQTIQYDGNITYAP